MNTNIVKTEVVTGHIVEVPTHTENREGGRDAEGKSVQTIVTVPCGCIFVKPGEHTERKHKLAKFGLTRPALGTERNGWLKASNAGVYIKNPKVGQAVKIEIKTDDSGSKQASAVWEAKG